jgi:ABC-type microcin C transport system permease subunit YejB
MLLLDDAQMEQLVELTGMGLLSYHGAVQRCYMAA